MVRRPGSGPIVAPLGIIFADVSDTSGLRMVPYSEKASPGANIECECKCTLTHRVICKKSFGTFDVSQATFVCPDCGEVDSITPITVGFMRCKYRFKGIKYSGEEYTSEWKDVTTDDYYQLFDSDKEISWLRLEIETASVDEVDDCAICLEPLSEFESLGCGHRFHKPCIEQWIGLPCPICRFVTGPTNIPQSSGGEESGEEGDEEIGEEGGEESA
ncbi:hypothetical protein BGZ97_010428 [Linnemannia gamsii]|uniref:RING-type E3 ubiquitin transferase n=1 Tax=Linnemannia gamsii TaxID=64522 RepID=A0A9P6R9Z0_9FUNG|nr:hypothetical protein BGZ97_010428 [Linnemannia gamsii]